MENSPLFTPPRTKEMVPSDEVLGLDELPILFGVGIDVWCRNLSCPPGQTVSEDVAQYGVGVESAFRVR